MATNQQAPAPDVNSALQGIINRSDWRQQLVTDYTETAQRLQAAYGRMLPNLQASAGDLVDRINQWVVNNPDDKLTAEYVKGFKQYQDLLARVEVEMNDFATLLKSESGILEARAIETGAQGALEMAQAVSGGAGQIVAAAWNRVDPVALVKAIGFVDSDAFRQNIATFGENAASSLADVILAGIAQGKSPLAISSIMQNWFSLPASWSNTTVRTVQLWSYRTASHEMYKQNSDVVTGWVWVSSLDDRTCSGCLAMHGSVHTNDEVLDGHHNCRCAAVPLVKGTNWIDSYQTGEMWLADQSPELQRSILGAGKFELYQSGNFDWSKATTHYENDVFGTMRRENTLAGMTG